MRERIELAVREILQTVETVEAAQRAIVAAFPLDMVLGPVSVGITEELRYATLVGQPLSNGVAFRTVVRVPRNAWVH